MNASAFPLVGLLSVLAALTCHAQYPPLDNFSPTLAGDYPWPYALGAQADGQLLVGGGFTLVNGQAHNRIARLNPDGTLDPAFAASTEGNFPFVLALAAQPDGKIVLGGQFTSVNSSSLHGRIARLNSDGSLDQTFAYSANAQVYALCSLPDGSILAGGAFTAIGNSNSRFLARLKAADGSADSSFQAQPNDSVYSVAPAPDGQLVVGGHFTQINSESHPYVGRLTSFGAPDSTFTPTANSDVLAVALQADGKILVGGKFTLINGQAHNRLARLNSDGTLDNDFNPNANADVVSVLLQTDGRVVVGGSFTVFNGQARQGLVRLEPDGMLDSSFNPPIQNQVMALAPQANGDLLVGGDSVSAQRNLVRLSSSAGAVQRLTYDGSQILWRRQGACPEVSRATFEFSTDRFTWYDLGAPLRTSAGWQLTNLVVGTGATIRARGMVNGGYQNGSSYFVERILPVVPCIATDDGCMGLVSNRFGFNFQGLPSQRIAVEVSTDLRNWLPIQTNTLVTNTASFLESAPAIGPQRFYRLRIAPP